jgi:ABC-type proline/glycine betaine transport system permease subunit
MSSENRVSRPRVTRVELPLAVPVIMGGVRNAALQVISTTTVAAYINLGGPAGRPRPRPRRPR